MENQLFFFILFVSLPLFILWRRFRSRNDGLNLLPGPRKLPIIGNMHLFYGSQPHHRLTELAKQHGPLMHLQLGEISAIVISSAEVAKEAMKTQDLIFASKPTSFALSIITYNERDIAFCPYGEHWRQMKKICILELFSAKRVQSHKSIREEEISHLLRSIASKAGGPVNLTQMLMSLTYCILSRTAFGRRKDQKDAFTPVVQKIMAILGGFTIADLFPSITVLQVITGMRTKLQKLHEEVDTIFEGIIREHREKRKGLKNMEADDFVNVLLNLQDDGMLKTEDIKAVILDMFLAGIETSSSTVEWAMSNMMKQPKIFEKAKAEVRQVLGRNDKLVQTNMNDLTYLNLIIKETLRLHPPGPLLARETRERTEICGYSIPEKSRVMINAFAISRDPNHWIEPEKFYPERFLNSSVDYKGTNFEYIPFGAGRRMCPGLLYGISLVELVLANLLYHFDWKIPNEGKLEDLDMSEAFGVIVRRKTDLCLTPIPVSPIMSGTV